MSKIVPVILSGGSGSRLWPLSRENTPKQFLKLMDGLTLLQRTAKRTRDIFNDDNLEIVTVTLHSMYEETSRQLRQVSPSLAHHILLEPEARNTAAAVALAVHYVEQTFGEDALIWILPADHHIGNAQALKEALDSAVHTAHEDYLVTFGIQPTRPETGYGYICKGGSVNGNGSCLVERFIEKPNLETASELVQSGQYLWSSGMHVFRAKTARDNFIRFAPDSWNRVVQSISGGSHHYPTPAHYAQINKEPFETAVVEKAEKLAVVPCDPGWSDIGCWESIWEIKNKDGNGNALTGDVFCEDTQNSMVLAEDRLVTCVGLKDIVIIETRDSILVADKKCNGSLKTMVQTLQKNKRRETVIRSSIQHDWGCEYTIADTAATKISELVIKQNNALSGDIEHQAAQLTVLSGEGRLTLDGKARQIGPGETITLNQDSVYGIFNSRTEPLRLLFVQFIQPLRDAGDALPDHPWNAISEVPSHMAA